MLHWLRFCAFKLKYAVKMWENKRFFTFREPVEYSAMMLKLCGKMILVWVLREILNAILVICILNHPL